MSQGKNGREIYDGDIVRRRGSSMRNLSLVTLMIANIVCVLTDGNIGLRLFNGFVAGASFIALLVEAKS